MTDEQSITFMNDEKRVEAQEKLNQAIKHIKDIQTYCNQDKENSYPDIGDFIGDLVEIITKEDRNNVYTGEIIDFGLYPSPCGSESTCNWDVCLRIQLGTEYDGIHPFITIGFLPKIENRYSNMEMFWIESIVNIKVLRLGC